MKSFAIAVGLINVDCYGIGWGRERFCGFRNGFVVMTYVNFNLVRISTSFEARLGSKMVTNHENRIEEVAGLKSFKASDGVSEHFVS